MTRAILISGGAYRFTEEQRAFEHYLVREVGVGRNQIRCFGGASSDMHVVLDVHVAIALQQKSAYPLILHFNGHGSPRGWSLDEDQVLRYDMLAPMLRDARRPVLVVNDCCHAMSLAEQCTADGVSADNVGIIAASECDEVTTAWLGGRLRDWWQRRRPNRLGNELRWGAAFDSHFYPRETGKEATT